MRALIKLFLIVVFVTWLVGISVVVGLPYRRLDWMELGDGYYGGVPQPIPYNLFLPLIEKSAPDSQ